MFTKHRPIVLILCLALTAGAAWSRDLWPVRADEGVFYVDDDACPGPGYGTRSDPFCRIQDAVDAACAYGEIRVAAGTYAGAQEVTDSRTGYTYTQVVFITQSLTLRGSYDAGNWSDEPDPTAHPTIIDAEGSGRGVSIVGAYGDLPSVTLEGLTITGGDYTGLGNPAGVGNRVCFRTGYDCGGGLFAHLARIVVRNSVITDNVAGRASSDRNSDGGGIYLWNTDADSRIENTDIVRNSTSGVNGGGGGIYVHKGASLTLSGDTIEDNQTPDGGGGMSLFQPVGPVVIERTDFIDNTTTNINHGGGALKAHLNCDGQALQVDRVRMIGNVAQKRGAAIYLIKQSGSTSSTARLTNVILTGNQALPGNATDSVIAIGLGYDFEVTMAHVTAADNPAPTFLWAESPYSGYTLTCDLTNTLIQSATNAFAGNWQDGYGDMLIEHTHTLIHDVTTLHYAHDGTPNFASSHTLTGDPRLRDDAHLSSGSPAIDAGTDAGVTVDIDGDPRPQNKVPDIGADEAPCWTYLPLVIR